MKVHRFFLKFRGPIEELMLFLSLWSRYSARRSNPNSGDSL